MRVVWETLKVLTVASIDCDCVFSLHIKVNEIIITSTYSTITFSSVVDAPLGGLIAKYPKLIVKVV